MVYVAKGTPPGYNVHTAADFLQSFNSNWPLLKQHSTGNYGGAVSHNLGYPPFHLLASDFTPGAVDGLVDNYGVDSSILARSSGSGSPRYYIFRLDLTSDFTAPTISTDTSVDVKNEGYVFKLAKQGASSDSTDMRDYALHSKTKSPMLHKVKHAPMVNTGGGLGWELTIPHGLKYIPTAFVFMKPGTNFYGLNTSRYAIMAPAVGVSGKYWSIDDTNVYVTVDNIDFTGTPFISVVVLKDPFNKKIINVSYP